MIRKIYETQKQIPSVGDFYEIVKNDMHVRRWNKSVRRTNIKNEKTTIQENSVNSRENCRFKLFETITRKTLKTRWNQV